ncbi:hypothetical protein CPB86DRAFT_275628 [Serendipita vermifera]|nr:hypothetical protein CPB86DRAFT_275628 [Serendipita vermifera]
MTTPPSSSTAFERAMALQDSVVRGSSQPPSRHDSEIQHIDPSIANANSGSLDVPYQAQSASWDADFPSAQTTSPGFPYTPSYRESFTPYGSDSGISWTGRESGANQLYDEPVDANDVEYNPADFDGPGSHSNVTSPYLLDQEPSLTVPSSAGYNGDQMMGNQGHLSPRIRSFSTESKSSYGGTPHARMNSLDVNSFSPRPYSAPSPASSVGGLDIERPRSRASSVSSNHQATPSLTVGPMGDAFDKMGFDVDSDLVWRSQQQQTQQQQQLNGQGGVKVQSPPQLFIPNEGSSSTLQIPSFGTQASLGTGLSTGGLGLSAPGINILPATPVSGGGAGASHVPFDTVLKNLNDRRQQSNNGGGSNDESLTLIQSHGKSNLQLCTFPVHTAFPTLSMAYTGLIARPWAVWKRPLLPIYTASL